MQHGRNDLVGQVLGSIQHLVPISSKVLDRQELNLELQVMDERQFESQVFVLVGNECSLLID